MQVTFNKYTALAILRTLRSEGTRVRPTSWLVNPLPPDASPRQYWTKALIRSVVSDLSEQHPGLNRLEELRKGPWNIAVPAANMRLRTSGVTNTVYERPLPAGSFALIGKDIAISSPELLFIELASCMKPIEAVMLGHEFCGTFCRDAGNPYNGPIAYGATPLTSVAKIHRFLKEVRHIPGAEASRKALRYLNDNAWSPTESLVTALLRLPIDDLGYDMGSLVLNPRVDWKGSLPNAKTSRVPDIMIDGTSVGLNYDGLVHLDLNSIVKAAIEVGANPGAAQTQAALDATVRRVRSKAVDDIRRNRELATDGLSVFPLLKEDLYIAGGLDSIVAQLIATLEKTGRTMDRQKRTLLNRDLCDARYRTALSFLPGQHERNVVTSRFIQGHRVIEGPSSMNEGWVEL